jgi:subtilisin-like proprotein convertase family protein
MNPRYVPTNGFLATLATVALLATAAPAFAKDMPAVHPALLDHRQEEKSVIMGKQRISLDSGVPRALYNVDYKVAPAEPEVMARQYLSENATMLRLGSAALSDLSVRATRRGLAATTVRFEQRVGGIPVLAPDIAVTIDKSSTVTFVMNGYQPGLSVETTTPQIGSDVARADALQRLGITGALVLDDTRLRVVPDGKTARLAWQVRIVPTTAPHGDWEVLVDARTGEIFRVVNNALHANGTGFVFDPDPLGTAHVFYGAPYNDAADATNASLDAARSSRTLLDITDLGGGTFKLQGPYAEITDFEAPLKGLFTQAGSTFNFDRSADAFEAVNTYYHVDHVMRFLNVTLGVPVTPFQYAGGVRFDPHGLSGADNSHYLPGTGQISFGEGGVDDAEDADVVIHELGHGLHDWLTSGSLSQVNGLSEGVGDYFCQSYSLSLGQWLSSEAPFHWTFSWDGHNEFWGGRITNYGALYPGGLVGQIHTDGQIWATSLMRIWNDIGRAKTDAAVCEGLAMTNSSSNQNDAAQAVLAAAVAMGYNSSEINSIVTHFQATGYSVSVGVDFVTTATGDECASDPSNENGLIEPGEEVELRVSVEAASVGHTGVSGTLTSTTPGVTILDGTATWPNLAPGVPTVCDAPYFRVKLDESVACLSTVSFQLSLTSNEGGPFPMSFSRPVGASLEPGGLPLAIPDNNVAGTTSVLNVGTNVVLTDVNVRVEITHTWVGDLFIKLRSPLGTEVTLLDQPGVPASTFGCGSDNMNVTFDDAAVQVLESFCPGTNPWYAGPARAVGLLSAFNGQSSQGDWTLTVSDRAGQDLGTVVDWELITTPALAGTCDVCASVDAPIAIGPQRFELSSGRPNPFTRSTDIRFQLAKPGRATLSIYDVAGHMVSQLVDRDMPAGWHTVTWDGTGRDRTPMAPGIYFYKLTSEGQTASKSVLRLR